MAVNSQTPDADARPLITRILRYHAIDKLVGAEVAIRSAWFRSVTDGVKVKVSPRVRRRCRKATACGG
ncbi:hypothetical protein KCP70_15515 [Salmonella enterica subsp. enterica]|nr:hypothetical protein KCP70_15515 [Salmonella enterica subsp. enterica]